MTTGRRPLFCSGKFKPYSNAPPRLKPVIPKIQKRSLMQSVREGSPFSSKQVLKACRDFRWMT